jgi:asparagine synthase (glutamine-hydrolysing)
MLDQIMKYVRKSLGIGSSVATVPDNVKSLIARIREKKLTYLTDTKLLSLATTCQNLEKRKLNGLFLEAGCALGGSSILMASIKSDQRPLLIYDVFGMIPPPTDQDTQDVHERYKTISEGKSTGIDGDRYYGYEENLYEIVLSNFRAFDIDCEQKNVQLIKGLVQETMRIDQPVALAHIDVDWYEPVMTCLTRIFPHLIVGGSIILDDYHDWGGCRKATDEYLLTVPGQFLLDDSAGSLKVTRSAPKSL